MKNKKIKLQLNKETIEVLNEMQLNQMHGGTNGTVVQSSLKCLADAYGLATIVDGAAKGQSWWGCPYTFWEPEKSQHIKFEQKPNGQLDNTNVNTPNGAFICIKPY
jgi:hypothetical protein